MTDKVPEGWVVSPMWEPPDEDKRKMTAAFSEAVQDRLRQQPEYAERLEQMFDCAFQMGMREIALALNGKAGAIRWQGFLNGISEIAQEELAEEGETGGYPNCTYANVDEVRAVFEECECYFRDFRLHFRLGFRRAAENYERGWLSRARARTEKRQNNPQKE